MSHTTEVMAIFVRLFAYFGQNLVVMATSLGLAIRNVFPGFVDS